MGRHLRRVRLGLALGAAFALSACASTSPVGALPDEVRVTFVGTGGPELTPHREGVATLVTFGQRHVLFDVGRNAMQNLYEAGVDPRDVTRIFLTHLHNDHIEGLATLWMTGWFLLGRTQPLEVWGPQGTRAMIEGMYAMHRFDIEHRANEFNDARQLAIVVHEFEQDGVLLDENGLRIEAFAVQHDDGDPAFGFAVNAGAARVVLTGDTRGFEGLAEHGKGADLLVSNVLAMPATLAAAPEMQGVVAKLMTIESAAALFRAARPRLAVYSHFVGKDLPHDADAFITRETRAAGYTGALLLARDGWCVSLPSLRQYAPPKSRRLPSLDRKRAATAVSR